MVIRVSNDVLVVPPFDCAWLSSPDAYSLTTASSEGGEGIVVSFDAKADSDVTVILKGRRTSKSELDSRPSRRLDHWSGRQDDPAKVDASTYLVIIGSHRNSACVIDIKRGFSRRMAHLPRHQKVSFGSLHERLVKDPTGAIDQISTKRQLAEQLTKGLDHTTHWVLVYMTGMSFGADARH